MSSTAVRVFAIILAASLLMGRAAAAQAQDPEPTVTELVAIVKNNPDPERRIAAIKKLAGITKPADERDNLVTETLIDAAKSTQDSLVGEVAVRALKSIQKIYSQAKTKYLPTFTFILRDPKALPSVRAEIAQLFIDTLEKGQADAAAFHAIKDIAKNRAEQSIPVRCKCIEALVNSGDPEAMGIFSDALSEPDNSLKESATRAIKDLLMKDPNAGTGLAQTAVSRIIDMMNDEALDKDLRIVAIQAVGQLIASNAPGAARGLDILMNMMLVVPVDEIVRAAIEAVGTVGTAQSAAPLIRTYDEYFDEKKPTSEKDVPVRHAAVKALRSLLSTQAVKIASDMATVHSVALKLEDVLDKDPVMPIKESAVYALSFLHPKKFEAEQKPAITALVALFEKLPPEAALKDMIGDTMNIIAQKNFSKNIARWKEWLRR
ncbi:MAG TPA: hypothetical protein VKX17_14740 [Planctomycetota bacterium]|nr:hypothetical protein [Planctomycetota bacterium]